MTYIHVMMANDIHIAKMQIYFVKALIACKISSGVYYVNL